MEIFTVPPRAPVGWPPLKIFAGMRAPCAKSDQLRTPPLPGGNGDLCVDKKSCECRHFSALSKPGLLTQVKYRTKISQNSRRIALNPDHRDTQEAARGARWVRPPRNCVAEKSRCFEIHGSVPELMHGLVI